MQTIIRAYTLSECMEAMANRVAALEKQGEKNLIFCEDRLTLIAERALLKQTGGTFLSSVSTFARFLNTEEKTLSKQGSVMAVGEVMTRLQREGILQCFTSVSGIANNAKTIYETLAQFSASEITPQMLKNSAAQLSNDALKKKTLDLAAIYQGYQNFLQERAFLDESAYLALLPKKLREDKLLKDTNVFFLCFPSFTAQAAQTIRAAIESAKNVFGVFCYDTEDFYVNRGAEIFTRVCAEYGTMGVVEQGIPLLGEAETLRKGLFNPERFGIKRTPTEKIRLFEAENKMGEAEYVAVQIRRAMQQDNSLRYRDFAVLTPSTSAYSLALKRALGEYGLPYFIDEKKTLLSHPLSRFVLDCLRVVKEKYSPASVQSLTQNPFFGESDNYRNYLWKYANYRGGAKREIKNSETIVKLYDISRLEQARERLLLATKNIKARGQGRDYCNAVRKILTDFQAKERLEKLEEQTQDLSQKSYLSQIYGAIERLLAEAETLTFDKGMSVHEFSAVLQDGLQASEISLIPLKADAIFVGDIVDSRIEKIRILFAMGMTEDVPRHASDAAIITDRDIKDLDEVKAKLEPTVAEVNLRARESVCLNLCTFLDELHLSYPLSADGSEPTLSDVYRYIDALFCDGKGEPLVRRKQLLDSEFPYRCSAPAPAIRQLLTERAQYENKKEDSQKQYASLYSALDKLSVQEKDDFLNEGVGQVCVERGEELFFRDGKISPTALENYFTCPFKNFAEKGLRLKEREETAVMAVDSGNFIHELLQRTLPNAKQVKTEEQMREVALQTAREILKNPVYSSQSDTAFGGFFGDKLISEGAEVVVAAYRQIKNSDFHVEQTESSVSTPEFYGKVDRIDGTEQYVRIIDYKTGVIDDSAVSYYTGRKLQMQLYMTSLQGERIPAGVFYFPASLSYSEKGEEKFQMKGFLNGDEKAILCGDKNVTEEKQSAYFPAALKNTRSKRVMDENTFKDFLDYSVFVARQACTELKDGFVKASPYAKTCEYCAYGGMCGFQKGESAERTETSIEPSGIANIVRQTRDGKGE